MVGKISEKLKSLTQQLTQNIEVKPAERYENHGGKFAITKRIKAVT